MFSVDEFVSASIEAYRTRVIVDSKESKAFRANERVRYIGKDSRFVSYGDEGKVLFDCPKDEEHVIVAWDVSKVAQQLRKCKVYSIEF